MAALCQARVANDNKNAQKYNFPYREYGFEPLETRWLYRQQQNQCNLRLYVDCSTSFVILNKVKFLNLVFTSVILFIGLAAILQILLSQQLFWRNENLKKL